LVADVNSDMVTLLCDRLRLQQLLPKVMLLIHTLLRT